MSEPPWNDELFGLRRAAETEKRKGLKGITGQASVLHETEPMEDEEFYELSEEELKARREICMQIITGYTHKEEEYFNVLPTEMLSHFAVEIHHLADKEKSEAGVAKCLKATADTHDRIAAIDKALKSNDRPGMLETIEKLTGIKAEERRREEEERRREEKESRREEKTGRRS